MNEKILANPEAIKISEEIAASDYAFHPENDLPDELKELFEGTVSEHIKLLGTRTAEMHKALGLRKDLTAFSPEPYSLHYQQSLYAGLQSLVRNTFHQQLTNISRLDEEQQQEVKQLLESESEILSVLKNIHKKKIDVVKIRTHGDFHLGQVLFTGKDFIITDFEGEPARSYTERRLKRSPLRDVAGMIRSFHYATYASLLLDNQIRKEDFKKLIPVLDLWYTYVSHIYIKSYIEGVAGTGFIPKNKDDFEILLNTFLLEKALYELNYEVNNRPNWIIIPLKGINTILKKSKKPHDEIHAVGV
jgi:maltose alpha-D-glucosyltransferase/alpha-amylase